jgi:hypothetical protein
MFELTRLSWFLELQAKNKRKQIAVGVNNTFAMRIKFFNKLIGV